MNPLRRYFCICYDVYWVVTSAVTVALASAATALVHPMRRLPDLLHPLRRYFCICYDGMLHLLRRCPKVKNVCWDGISAVALVGFCRSVVRQSAATLWIIGPTLLGQDRFLLTSEELCRDGCMHP